MNLQCKRCKEPTPDDETVNHYGYITCEPCAPHVAMADIVQVITSTSYSGDAQAQIVRIVTQLEADNARLTHELGVARGKKTPHKPLGNL